MQKDNYFFKGGIIYYLNTIKHFQILKFACPWHKTLPEYNRKLLITQISLGIQFRTRYTEHGKQKLVFFCVNMSEKK